MAGATATADGFSPSSASATSGTAIANGSATGEPRYGSPFAFSISPSQDTYGSSGGMTSASITCQPCCVDPTNSINYHLTTWFGYPDLPGRPGYGGICRGAVDNTKPLKIYGTFTLYEDLFGGLFGPFGTPADNCIVASSTVEFISSVESLKLTTKTTCPTSITPPTTRFSVLKAAYDSAINPDLAFLINPDLTISGGFYLCGCAADNFSNRWFLFFKKNIQPSSYTCSPFSITWDDSAVSSYQSWGMFCETGTTSDFKRLRFKVTFTL